MLIRVVKFEFVIIGFGYFDSWILDKWICFKNNLCVRKWLNKGLGFSGYI